jgi:Predicted membrane protein (DUF2339)
MSTHLDDRIDEFERKLHALQRELEELRALARVEVPPSDQRDRLREIATAIRRAEADGDAGKLRALAASADNISPSADPAWRAYAQQLADHARALADRVGKQPSAATTAEADVREALRALAGAVRRAEARRDAQALRAIADEAAKLAPETSDERWRAYALRLAEYAGSAAEQAPQRPSAAPAAKPQPRPQPTRRTVAQLAADWDLLGARGVALAGGVVTLLGIVFFFVLATNRGWIGPLARVSLGAAASALLFAAGLVIHRRYGQLHAALAACGAGIAGGYATLAAATILYDLLPAAGALVAAAAIAAAGVVVALAWSSQALAALGFLGAALSPAALALDEGISAAGTAFAAVVFAALVAVAVRRAWERLLVAGVIVTVGQVVWLVAAAPREDAPASVVAAVVVAELVAAGAAWQLAARRPGLDGLAATLAGTSVALALGSSLRLYPDPGDQAIALFVAAAGFALACAVLLRRAHDLAWSLGGGALVLTGVATADLVSGPSLAIAWAGQSLLASALAHRLRERRFVLFAYAYLALSTVAALGFFAPDMSGESFTADPHAVALVAAALASLAAGLLAPARATPPSTAGILRVLVPLHEWLGEARIGLRALLAGLSAALLALAAADALDGAWLALTYAAASGLLTLAAYRLRELRLVPFGLAAAALAVGHALSLDAPLVPELHPELSAGLAGAGAVAAAAVATALAALLLPAAQRSIAWLGPLTGPELPLQRLVEGREALRAALAGLAALLTLGAAGLALADLFGDAGHVVTVVLWSAAGLAAVVAGSPRSRAAFAWAGGGLLTATLIKVVGYDWPQLGHDQGAAELLVCAAAILAAGWLARALSPSREPVTAISAVAAGVSLASTIAALGQLVPSDRAAGAIIVGVAAVYGVLAAVAQRRTELRNLATAMWVPGVLALLLAEALLIEDRNIAVAYAATAVALAATARVISEPRLRLASLVLLGATTVVTFVALTPPTRLLEASAHPGTSAWTIAACAIGWAVLAALEPRLRERLGWLAAAIGLYTASLLILEVAERVSTASVQTDFERGHTAVSALWGAVGLALLVAGLLRDSRALRLGGLALFGVSLTKLFLYDLSTLSSVTRAFSFLAVGALLLAGGFFLQKLSRRLEETQSPPASSPG